jgi:hypothetical protein
MADGLNVGNWSCVELAASTSMLVSAAWKACVAVGELVAKAVEVLLDLKLIPGILRVLASWKAFVALGNCVAKDVVLLA